MKKQEDIQKELDELAPFLAKMERKKRTDIPPNYFQKLPFVVLERVHPRKEEQPSIWNNILLFFQPFFQPKITVGFATIALLISTVIFITNSEKTNASYFASLQATEINTYILNNIEDFEEELFYASSEEELFFDFINEDFNDTELDFLMESVLEEMDIESLEEIL